MPPTGNLVRLFRSGWRNRKVEPGQFGVNQLGEFLERLRPRHEAPVDEEGGRPGDAQGLSLGDVGVDHRFASSRVEGLLETLNIEPQLPRVLQEGVALELLLVGEYLIVELPELPLLMRGHRGGGRERRLLMKIERVVLPDDTDLIAVDLLNLFEGRTDLRAEWSLELGELCNGDRGVRRTLERRAIRFDRVDAVGIGALLRRCRRWSGCGLLHLSRELC